MRGALAYGLASAFVRTHLVSQNKWIHGGHMFYEVVLVQVLQVRGFGFGLTGVASCGHVGTAATRSATLLGGLCRGLKGFIPIQTLN